MHMMRFLLGPVLAAALAAGGPAHAQPASPASATLSGDALDPSGALLPGVSVTLRSGADVRSASTDGAGHFALAGLPAGDYVLELSLDGFERRSQTIALRAGEHRRLSLTLQLAGVQEDVIVGAQRIAGRPEFERRVPGTLEVLDRAALDAAQPMTVNEALRKVSGLAARDEEGLGLRPNIGIRGLNPTRSSKTLLLEDGIPLTFAPYGDNASYYHPPIERFTSIEVLKGAGQIAYGPSTVGGVINYITPAPPTRTAGLLSFAGGTRSYVNGAATIGATRGRLGVLFDGLRKQADGSRDHTHSDLTDANLKVVFTASPAQVLTLKTNYYGERSQVTYSGLRADEYLASPRQNPFANDRFTGDRGGLSLAHTYALRDHVLLATTGYVSAFSRDWWRQSSNSAQRPNDSADPRCGGMANLLTTCGNEGRLRDYWAGGIESRVELGRPLGARLGQTSLGVRVHGELQRRRQENGDAPTARSGLLVEHNERSLTASSAFLQHRFVAGPWSVSPGVRVEHIRFSRTNLLANGGLGVEGSTSLTQVIPGAGISYSPAQDVTVFAGLHRGFAPPRVEDAITNTGGIVDLDAELSWNTEVGVRSRPVEGLRLDAAFFRMDYENQIVPATLAGGVGAVLTNAGETLHQGIELSARLDSEPFERSAHGAYARIAYTFLPVARFDGVRLSAVRGFEQVSVTGNRLPYAPRHLLTAGLGAVVAGRLDALLEAVRVSSQFGDDLNTIEGTADGQRGLIPDSTVWNATISYRPWSPRATAFVSVKNLLDRTVIVDRTRGILPNPPRVVHAGLRVVF
jgi:Fe(3+) dicitrate transport protein